MERRQLIFSNLECSMSLPPRLDVTAFNLDAASVENPDEKTTKRTKSTTNASAEKQLQLSMSTIDDKGARRKKSVASVSENTLLQETSATVGENDYRYKVSPTISAQIECERFGECEYKRKKLVLNYDEFWSFVFSAEWKNETALRVVGGGLLERLIVDLQSLVQQNDLQSYTSAFYDMKPKLNDLTNTLSATAARIQYIHYWPKKKVPTTNINDAYSQADQHCHENNLESLGDTVLPTDDVRRSSNDSAPERRIENASSPIRRDRHLIIPQTSRSVFPEKTASPSHGTNQSPRSSPMPAVMSSSRLDAMSQPTGKDMDSKTKRRLEAEQKEDVLLLTAEPAQQYVHLIFDEDSGRKGRSVSRKLQPTTSVSTGARTAVTASTVPAKSLAPIPSSAAIDVIAPMSQTRHRAAMAALTAATHAAQLSERRSSSTRAKCDTMTDYVEKKRRLWMSIKNAQRDERVRIKSFQNARERITPPVDKNTVTDITECVCAATSLKDPREKRAFASCVKAAIATERATKEAYAKKGPGNRCRSTENIIKKVKDFSLAKALPTKVVIDPPPGSNIVWVLPDRKKKRVNDIAKRGGETHRIQQMDDIKDVANLRRSNQQDNESVASSDVDLTAAGTLEKVVTDKPNVAPNKREKRQKEAKGKTAVKDMTTAPSIVQIRATDAKLVIPIAPTIKNDNKIKDGGRAVENKEPVWLNRAVIGELPASGRFLEMLRLAAEMFLVRVEVINVVGDHGRCSNATHVTFNRRILCSYDRPIQIQNCV